MRTYLQSQAMAKSLRESMAARDIALSDGECLEIVARQLGFGNWNILAAKIEIDTREPEARPTPGAVELNQVLPVLAGWVGLSISTAGISHAELMIFGALIVWFLIVEPHGLARLWATGKQKLRLWPFPH